MAFPKTLYVTPLWYIIAEVITFTTGGRRQYCFLSILRYMYCLFVYLRVR